MIKSGLENIKDPLLLKILHALSQSMKCFNKNVNSGSNLSSSKNTEDQWAFNIVTQRTETNYKNLTVFGLIPRMV